MLEWNLNLLDKIYIFDFGFEDWQVEVLQNISLVEIFRFSDNPSSGYPFYEGFDINDASTYFFKVYAYHEVRPLVAKAFSNSDINLLWMDSGNFVQYPLNEVFSIIEKSYFFIDHDDVGIYYDNPQNNLINILSPCLFESKELNLEFPAKNNSLALTSKRTSLVQKSK